MRYIIFIGLIVLGWWAYQTLNRAPDYTQYFDNYRAAIALEYGLLEETK